MRVLTLHATRRAIAGAVAAFGLLAVFAATSGAIAATQGAAPAHPVVVSGSVTPSDLQWNGVTPADLQWNGITPADLQWNAVTPADLQWNGIRPNDLQWN